jgi:hypothetical protein
MEFVIVTCDDEQRPVFIDNQEQGVTDSRLSVPEGLHVFDLGVPRNYTPPFLEVLVEKTTHLDPMPIPFSLIAAREMVPRKRAAKRASKGARKRARTTSSRKQAGGKRKTARKPATARRSAKKTAARKKVTAKGRNKKR